MGYENVRRLLCNEEGDATRTPLKCFETRERREELLSGKRQIVDEGVACTRIQRTNTAGRML
jgi:hypothetical protein